MLLRGRSPKQSPSYWRNLLDRIIPCRGGCSLALQRTPDLPSKSGASVVGKSILLATTCWLFVSSCSATPAPATPQVVSVYSTSAAEPWLPPLYDCAGTSTAISRVDDSSSADIVLRVGEPKILTSAAYQIDSEDILIVTHRQSPVQNLTLEAARALFAGQGDPSVQVWVYASEEDVQEMFDRVVMAGLSVASSAHVALTPQQMSDTLVNETNSVGILPRHWKAGDDREVFMVATVPVLVLVNAEPQGAIRGLLACLQK